jgi:hypothetical protein
MPTPIAAITYINVIEGQKVNTIQVFTREMGIQLEILSLLMYLTVNFKE